MQLPAAVAFSLELFWKGDAWARHTQPSAPWGAWCHPHGQRDPELCQTAAGSQASQTLSSAIPHPAPYDHAWTPLHKPACSPGPLSPLSPRTPGAEGPLPKYRQVSSRAARTPAAAAACRAAHTAVPQHPAGMKPARLCPPRDDLLPDSLVPKRHH